MKLSSSGCAPPIPPTWFRAMRVRAYSDRQISSRPTAGVTSSSGWTCNDAERRPTGSSSQLATYRPFDTLEGAVHELRASLVRL